MDIGSAVSRAKGVRAEQIVELGDYLESPQFDARERTVLAYVDAMTTTPASVDDRLFARLRQYFDEAQIVELTAAIAWENYRSRFNRALAIESDHFAEGSACALPVRRITQSLPAPERSA
jgi:alkylhydroperoxidase family enzyme